MQYRLQRELCVTKGGEGLTYKSEVLPDSVMNEMLYGSQGKLKIFKRNGEPIR